MRTVHAIRINVFALAADLGRSERKFVKGFTVMELLVVIAILVMLAAVLFPAFVRQKAMTSMTTCKNNLAQIGKALSSWSADHNWCYPMEVSVTNGGTKELVGKGKAFSHFLVLSNYLNTPGVLFCPADNEKGGQRATTFMAQGALAGAIPFTNDNNLSYFLNLGFPLYSSYPDAIISGDRNLTNSAGIRSGVLTLSSTQTVWWTSQMHAPVGNIALADGSVQGITSNKLQSMVQTTDTNFLRLAVP